MRKWFDPFQNLKGIGGGIAPQKSVPLIKRIFRILYKPNAMYHQTGVLDAYLTEDLKKLGEPDCESAIKFLRSSDYYLMISVDDLRLSTRAFDILKINKLDTVKDILEYGWENIGMLRNAGPQTVNEIKSRIGWIIAHKNKVRGMAGLQLSRMIGGDL